MDVLIVPEGELSDEELARFLVDLDTFVAEDEQQAAVKSAVAIISGEREFDESLHPRDEEGKFTDSGGSEPLVIRIGGAKPAAALPHPKDTPDQFSKRHLHAQIEHGAVFDAEGRKVIEREGLSVAEVARTMLSGAVEFKDEDVAYLKANPGTLVVHNHPASGIPVLSPEDIGFAATYKVAEMRVTSTKGTYAIKPPEAGWDAPSPMKAPADVREGGGPVLAKAGEQMSVQLAVRVALAQNATRYYIDHIRAASKAELNTTFVEHWRELARETGVRFEEPA